MTMVADPALLLIAHGTRNPSGATEMDRLCDHLRGRIDAPVAAAWLEDFCDPDAVTAANDLVAGGARHIVTLPFLVLGAGHAKTDVPAAVAAVRGAHPEATVVHGRVLGLHPILFDLAVARVGAVAGDDRDDEVLVVTGAGSSDPDANGDLAKAARLLAELTGHRWAEIAYAGVTWPRADALFSRLEAAGARRVIRFSWSLLAGVLEQRVDRWAREATARGGLQIDDAGRFGPDPLVADAVIDRYREALDGDPRMNCDLCAYRRPLPGFESRAGAPSAGGLGTAVHPSASA
ncbi:MAG: sirohydrochlorin chelatase [Actinobacteria bacterium]|nr:sirohydrochlorin chelatase [Actinomycetota bacterium]